MNGFVDAVLKMLQHQHDLVVAFVGDDGPDGADLQRKREKKKQEEEKSLLLDQSEDTRFTGFNFYRI